LGYLLYSSLFAGLAATCETEQELQMYMPLAAAPTWLSFALILLVINDSNSIWSVGASLFPPTAPVIMFLRMASQIPPAWQLAVSIGLMVVSIWGVLWFSTAALSRGHSDVRETRHVAGADALAALQLSSIATQAPPAQLKSLE
jgi:ABC-type Na+ efflux pump permease subunit